MLIYICSISFRLFEQNLESPIPKDYTNTYYVLEKLYFI